MASKVLKKINAKLKFLYRQSRYLTPAYRRLLCNALIQSHFDYGCSPWFPLLKTNLKLKLQEAQNRYIRFCLNLPARSHIDPSHFRKINWLPFSDRIEYCIANTAFKYWNGIVPGYIMKCLSLYSADIAQDHRCHWTYLCGHRLLLCMLLRKIFYFICKANSSYYHILTIDIIT